MHDHELFELSNGVRTTETKKTEGESVAGVSDAIRTGRPDALGPKGMLHLQRAAGNAGVSALVQRQDEEQSPVHDVIRSPGQSLPEDTRTFMEQRMGQDFSDVRIHTDSAAANSAKSVQAQAYTVGNNIVFNEGKFDPDSDTGKHTLAHELTHVVQQRNGPVSGTPAGGGIKVSDPDDSYEQAAESNAKSVLSDAGPVTAGAGGGAAGVQRQGMEEEEEAIQPMLQRQGEEEEEETMMKMPLQREAAPEEEELQDDTPVGAPAAQRQEEEEEMPMA